MSGSGGYRHRNVRKHAKRRQTLQKARANIARIRNQFESRGQAWDPANNQQQLAALNHAGRHEIVKRSKGATVA
jgi:hypothetical protein